MKRLSTVICLSVGIVCCQYIGSDNNNHNSNNNIDISSQEFGECRQLNTSFQYTSLSYQPQLDSFRFLIKFNANKLLETNLQRNVLNVVTVNQLQNIKRQLQVADGIYQNVLGLTAPLDNPRYQKAHFINVNMIEAQKAYGRAYDEVVKNKNDKVSACHIIMELSNQVNAEHNVTPAHELFHIYQNSVMMFKQSWLTEGTARWSESLIKESTGKEEALPETKEQLLEVMDSSYGASKFWIRLFRLIDPNDAFVVPNYLDTITYLNNEPVLQDNKAYGVTFIKVLFDELSKESDHVSELKGWDRYAWKEKDQKDPALNPYIWNAVKRAVAKSIPYEEQSEELRKCMEIEL